jgi:hypothetical protein
MRDYKVGTPVWVVHWGKRVLGIITNRKLNGEGEYVYAVVESDTGHIGIYLYDELRGIEYDKQTAQSKLHAAIGSNKKKNGQ